MFDAVCLRGVNGSGKTTYLEGIAQLFQWFRRCTKKRGWAKPTGTPLLAEAQLVAVRLIGLPVEPADGWLVFGQGEALRAFLSSHEDAFAAWTPSGPRWREGLLEQWDMLFSVGEMGQAKPPNIVWIEAEEKYVPALRGADLTDPKPTPPYQPVARYVAAARGMSHLEGILSTLKLVHPEKWAQLEAWVPKLFPGLSTAGFDESTRRPLFQVKGSAHPLTVDMLSSGERSALINLAMVLRWRGHGGILMVDEPELHQHLSLTRGSLALLQELATQGGGQLLVASHSPEVWAHFRHPGSLIELDGRAQ